MSADKTSLAESALTEKVIGAFYDVYNKLGTGFVDSVYENALALGLRETDLGEFRADLVLSDKLVVELKAV